MKHDIQSTAIDFNKCRCSQRQGSYVGSHCSIEGIIYDNENWIVKYSHGYAYLSEYIGSNIYKMLGCSVQETLLGIKNNYNVVAAKDFRADNELLLTFKTLKNVYISNNRFSGDMPIEAHRSNVYLEEILFHFKYNNILTDNKEFQKRVVERFWDCVVIDGFIANSARTNDNWGILRNRDTMELRLAPIYDNCCSLFSHYGDEKLKALFELDDNDLLDRLLNEKTAYSLNKKRLTFNDILNFDNPDLKKSILRVVSIIEHNIDELTSFIDSITEIDIPDYQRDLYKRILEISLSKILLPKYKELK